MSPVTAAVAMLAAALDDCHLRAGTHRTVENTGRAIFKQELEQALEAHPALRALIGKREV